MLAGREVNGPCSQELRSQLSSATGFLWGSGGAAMPVPSSAL